MRARYGITFTGLLLSGGAGVFLGIVPLGYLGLLQAALTTPSRLMALPGALVLGAVTGVIVAHATRARLRPATAHRYRRCALAGLVTMPGAVFAGQLLPAVADTHASSSGVVVLVLGCGVAGMVVYYRARKRRALHHRARPVAARHVDEHPALR